MNTPRAPLAWSGRPTGAFAVRTLTLLQVRALEWLRLQRPVAVDAGQHPSGEVEALGVSRQTATSLEQRRFIHIDETGRCTVTDHGLHALAVLAKDWQLKSLAAPSSAEAPGR